MFSDHPSLCVVEVEGDDGSHFSPNSAAPMMMMLAETLLDERTNWRGLPSSSLTPLPFHSFPSLRLYIPGRNFRVCIRPEEKCPVISVDLPQTIPFFWGLGIDERAFDVTFDNYIKAQSLEQNVPHTIIERGCCGGGGEGKERKRKPATKRT